MSGSISITGQGISLSLKMENSAVCDVREDLSNLLECLKTREDNKDLNEISEVMKTIVLVCSTDVEAKDIFRELGGLSVLFKLMCKTRSILILEDSLNALANVMDNNVHNQKIMSRKEVFQLIRGILSTNDVPTSLLKKTLFFTSVLLFQNNKAQILIHQTDCLQDLMDIYEKSFPIFMLDEVLSSQLTVSEAKQPSIELWLNINRTLCFAVNNPLNVNNQTMCSALFPLALRILRGSSSCEIIGAVSTFLTVTLENNIHNKDLFAEYDGPVVLRYCFFKGLSYVLEDIESHKAVSNKGYAEAVLSIVEVLDIAVSEHSQNSALIGKLGFLSWLLKLLQIDGINEEWKVKIVLTIGHCIDAYEKNVHLLMEEEELPNLLRCLMLNGDKDLLSACQYLIQVCFKNGASFDKQCVEKPSTNKVSDEKAILDIKHSSETIDLSSSPTLEQDKVNTNLPQEPCSANTVAQSNEHCAENEDCHTPPEQTNFHVNSVNTVFNRHIDSQNTSHCPGRNTEFSFHQPFTKTVSQTDDDDIFLLDEPEKINTLCCDYCSCVSHVISKYPCGCAVLHGCRCQNINCVESCHMYCPNRGQDTSSDDCVKYGCEKLCNDTSSCQNPHKMCRTVFSKLKEKSDAKHVIANESSKLPKIDFYSNKSDKSSSSSSANISNFRPEFFCCKEDTEVTQEQTVRPSHTMSGAALKESKRVNLRMDIQTEINTNVFKKPRELPLTKLNQTVLQNGRPLFRKVASRHHSSPSSAVSKGCSETSLQDSPKRNSSVSRTQVLFSPFRKLGNVHQNGIDNKTEDSESISETSGSESFSVFDMKLIRTTRDTPASQAHHSKSKWRKSVPLQQVKARHNNENRPTETISKYFVSSKQSVKQDAQSIRDQPCAKPIVSTNSRQSPHQEKIFASWSCGDETCLPHEKERHVSPSFAGKSGAEASNESCDTDVQVISVFGSTCSEHNLSNSSKMVHVITLES